MTSPPLPFNPQRHSPVTNNGHSQIVVEDKVYHSCLSHEHQYMYSTCHIIKSCKKVSTHPFERIMSMTLDFTLTRFVHKPNCDGTAFYCYFDAERKATPKIV